MVSRRCLAAIVVTVACLGLATGPGLGVARAAEPVASGLLGGGAPGPIPPLPLPGQPALPDNDPFYRAPANLDHYKPGTVLRSRSISAIGLTSLGSVSGYQLLFRSTDARKAPIAGVTTLLLPTVPGPGPRKLVSYQPAEDSLTTGCAPSYTLRTNSGLPQPAENGLIAAALLNGWDVVVPDHEGPRSELAVGPSGGRVTLDSIRAVENFGPSGVDGAGTPAAVMGYSGGSAPTLWAAALAHDYAPELNLVGAAAGGILADIGELLHTYANPPLFGAAIAVSVALDRAYPEFNLKSLLNDRGKALATRLGNDANGCIGALTSAPLDSVTTDTRFADMDALLAQPGVASSVDKVNLVAGPRLGVPSLLVQGIQDELVPVGQVDDLAAVNCRHGVAIDYQRIPGEHASTLVPYEALSLAFLKDRLAGQAPSNTCS